MNVSTRRTTGLPPPPPGVHVSDSSTQPPHPLTLPLYRPPLPRSDTDETLRIARFARRPDVELGHDRSRRIGEETLVILSVEVDDDDDDDRRVENRGRCQLD